MAIVEVGTVCLCIQAGLRLKSAGLAPFLYSSREPSELSQWLCYDDSTINIVVIIIIIIFIIIFSQVWVPGV